LRSTATTSKPSGVPLGSRDATGLKFQLTSCQRRPSRPQYRHLTWNGITARPCSSATRKVISALVGAGRELVVRVVAEADEGGAVAPQGLH
jgi:hypothetical protein